jgi:3-hydroxyacyl-[acyl-carrier protein] dehydratase/trans-2-decenoyl-[acyl-carrier protein] isomerase
MTFEEFQKCSRFGYEEIAAYARGNLISGDSPKLPALSDFLLLAFHEITSIAWDEASGTGRIVATRFNRLNDWFYSCHFLGDPVMPGCWGLDAIWQCLKFFAAWRGLSGCDKELGMEDVIFSGQIRPYDQKITYAIDIVSIKKMDGESLITGRAVVSVDGTNIYSMGAAQIGSTFWEKSAHEISATFPLESPLPFNRKLSYNEFTEKKSFSQTELIALSQGRLVENPPVEMGLLPSSFMLGIDSIHRLFYDDASGSGEILSSQDNNGLEWFYPMNLGIKPPALSIDSVWQLLGLFLTWAKTAGTGRALGFERVEVFDSIRPEDRKIIYEVQVLKVFHPAMTSDVFVKGDARVFADGRLILNCSNAHVGCHRNIRYLDYPVKSELAFGGNLRTRETKVGS